MMEEKRQAKKSRLNSVLSQLEQSSASSQEGDKTDRGERVTFVGPPSLSHDTESRDVSQTGIIGESKSVKGTIIVDESIQQLSSIDHHNKGADG